MLGFEEEVTRAVTEMGVEDVVQMLGFHQVDRFYSL